LRTFMWGHMNNNQAIASPRLGRLVECVRRTYVVGLLTITLILGCAGSAIGAVSNSRHHTVHQRRHKIARHAGWAGAGFAAGRVAGPAGSAAVGAAKYRHDLKAGGHRRKRAIAKIGAPIAAGAVAGPAGTAAYEAYDHRSWIKRHILHRKPHGSGHH